MQKRYVNFWKIEKYKTFLMKVLRSLHVSILEFIWHNQGRKFWKRNFNVKVNFSRLFLKQNFLSSEKFHFAKNWFSFSAGNLFFSVFFFLIIFWKKNIYWTNIFFKSHCFPFLAVHTNENLNCNPFCNLNINGKSQFFFSTTKNLWRFVVLAFQKD